MQTTQPSDKAVELLKEELGRLHQILDRPLEAPGKGFPKSHMRDWAKNRIERIHDALTGISSVRVPLIKNESK